MVDKINEQISALVDGELRDDESSLLLKRLAKDAELKHTMHHYQVMSQAMKSDLPFEGKFNLLVQINEILDEDASKVLSDSPDEDIEGDKKLSVLDQLAGFAIAATVAVVAVMVIETVPEGSAAPVQVAKQQGTHWISDQPMVESKLNAYLVKHNQSVVPAFHGANNVRLVGYDREVKK